MKKLHRLIIILLLSVAMVSGCQQEMEKEVPRKDIVVNTRERTEKGTITVEDPERGILFQYCGTTTVDYNSALDRYFIHVVTDDPQYECEGDFRTNKRGDENGLQA